MIRHQVPDSRFAASYHSYRPLPVFVPVFSLSVVILVYLGQELVGLSWCGDRLLTLLSQRLACVWSVELLAFL